MGQFNRIKSPRPTWSGCLNDQFPCLNNWFHYSQRQECIIDLCHDGDYDRSLHIVARVS